jgi:hypothetical protein
MWKLREFKYLEPTVTEKIYITIEIKGKILMTNQASYVIKK